MSISGLSSTTTSPGRQGRDAAGGGGGDDDGGTSQNPSTPVLQQSQSQTQPQQQPQQQSPTSVYRRDLPTETCVAFSSRKGKKIFTSAMVD